MDASFAPGTEFAGHRIEREIGRGGMGVVFAARHLALDQPRALKVLDGTHGLDPGAVERFRREARLVASVDHVNVVRTHDAGEIGGRPFIAMQLVDGVDLARLLEAGSLPPERAIPILRQVAAGLDAAHAAGLVHRDVKPENVLVAGPPGAERAYLGDFGIGILIEAEAEADRRLTAERRVIGTASYISPEQVEGGPIDGRADVYSLGCVAFEVLTGTVPFRAETQLATLSAHGSAPRPSGYERNPALPPGVDAVLAAAMAIDPADRPASATAFVDALAETVRAGVAGHRAPTQPLPAPGSRASDPARSGRGGDGVRSRLPVVAAVAGLAVLIVALVLILIPGGDGPERGAAALSIDVARDPVAVAAGAEYVWVASGSAGRVAAYDAVSGREAGLSYRVEGPRAAALGPGFLWVVAADNQLHRLATDGGDSRSVDLGLGDPVDVAVTPQAVFVLDRATQSRVIRVDPESLEQTGEAVAGKEAQALAFGTKAIWVANTGEGTVSQIDPGSVQRIGSTIQVGGRPEDIAASGGQVWVVDNLGGTLTPIDPSGESPSVGDTVETLPQPRAVALGFDSVWVASGEAAVVERFDTEGELVSETPVGEDPADVAVGSGRVWTPNAAAATVSGIDP